MADPIPLPTRPPSPDGLSVEELRVLSGDRELPITAVRLSDVAGRLWIEVDLGDTGANNHAAADASQHIPAPAGENDRYDVASGLVAPAG